MEKLCAATRRREAKETRSSYPRNRTAANETRETSATASSARSGSNPTNIHLSTVSGSRAPIRATPADPSSPRPADSLASIAAADDRGTFSGNTTGTGGETGERGSRLRHPTRASRPSGTCSRRAVLVLDRERRGIVWSSAIGTIFRAETEPKIS